MLDVANPAAPSLVANIATSAVANGSAIQGNYAYVADDGYYGSSSLAIYDVSNPALPVTLARIVPPESSVQNVLVVGGRMFVSQCYNGLSIYELSTPSTPVLVTHIPGPFDCLDRMELWGDFLYVTNANSGLKVFRVSGGPVGEVGSVAGPYAFSDVKVNGTYAYVGMPAGVGIIDLTNPTAPVFASTYPTKQKVNRMAFANGFTDRLYLANDSDGLVVLSLANPFVPVELASLDISGDVNTIFVTGNHAYMSVGGDRVSVVNISDPQSLSFSGSTSGLPGYPADITVNDSFVWISARDGGLQVLGKIPDYSWN
jgi:hypothetical protein